MPDRAALAHLGYDMIENLQAEAESLARWCLKSAIMIDRSGVKPMCRASLPGTSSRPFISVQRSGFAKSRFRVRTQLYVRSNEPSS